MRSFRAGSVYFIVWYHDQNYQYPSFESVIYIGKNLRSGDRRRGAWYFQDLDSYIAVGAYPRNRKGAKHEIHVYKFHQVDLELVTEGSGRVIDAAGLIAEISQWRSRVAIARRRKPTAKTKSGLRHPRIGVR